MRLRFFLIVAATMLRTVLKDGVDECYYCIYFAAQTKTVFVNSSDLVGRYERLFYWMEKRSTSQPDSCIDK